MFLEVSLDAMIQERNRIKEKNKLVNQDVDAHTHNET